MDRAAEVAVGGPPASARLAELYERHVGRAIALARLLTGDANVAEDVAHEAFIRVAGRLAGIRDQAAFEAYLRRTIVNLCRARWRRLVSERRLLSRLAARDLGRTTDPASPETVEHDVVWRALLDLPHRQRAAVVLRYYEDLSEEQVADVLRCSRRAVNSLVSRAMVTLRSRIETEEGVE